MIAMSERSTRCWIDAASDALAGLLSAHASQPSMSADGGFTDQQSLLLKELLKEFGIALGQ